MNILKNAAIATSAVLTIAKGAEAHPGHGTGGGGYALSHYLYRARDTKLDRDVALKVLPGALTA